MNYTVYVLIPSDTEEVEYDVASLMDPYSEDVEEEEYEMRCLCVENQFSKELQELIKRDFGEPRDLWKSLMKDKGFGDGEALWRDVMHEYRKFVDFQCAAFLKTSPPDPDCDECEGTGWKTTTFNFDSRWDGWDWDVSSQIIEGEVVKDRKLELDPEKQEETQPRVYDLKDIDIGRIEVPYAIFSPDGWDQCAEWTRHGPVYVPEEIWERTVRRTLDEYKEDHLLIPVNCHV
jgi:hypothetical protein